MATKVIVPQKKNYVPQFLKQRDINSYLVCGNKIKYSKLHSLNQFASFNAQTENIVLEPDPDPVGP